MCASIEWVAALVVVAAAAVVVVSLEFAVVVAVASMHEV